MNSDKNIPRFLGAAFLFVWAAFILAFALPQTLLSGSISEILVNISKNLTLMRISILVDLVNSAAIIVLGVLLYVVLYKQSKIIVLVALGLYLAEAITLAMSKIWAFALIPLSLEFVTAGAPTSPYFQTLGTLFSSVSKWGYDIHMWFFCLGAILWYTLFYRSKYIPRLLSGWGILAVSLILIVSVAGYLGMSKPIVTIIPNVLFELAIGLWLVFKGIKSYEPES